MVGRERAQARLREFGELCATHGVPCSGFHLSSGYTLDPEGRRNVFTWDRRRVPDPAAMFADFHARGMGVVPNIKPWLLKDSHPASVFSPDGTHTLPHPHIVLLLCMTNRHAQSFSMYMVYFPM